MAGYLSWRWYQPVSYVQIWFVHVWIWFSWDFPPDQFSDVRCEYWQLRAVAWSPEEVCDQNSTTNVFSYRRIANIIYSYKISIFNWKLFQSLTFFLNLLIFFTFFAIIGTIQMASQFSSLGPNDWLGLASNIIGQSLLLSQRQRHSLVVNRSKIVVFWIWFLYHGYDSAILGSARERHILLSPCPI